VGEEERGARAEAARRRTVHLEVEEEDTGPASDILVAASLFLCVSTGWTRFFLRRLFLVQIRPRSGPNYKLGLDGPYGIDARSCSSPGSHATNRCKQHLIVAMPIFSPSRNFTFSKKDTSLHCSTTVRTLGVAVTGSAAVPAAYTRYEGSPASCILYSAA
jgi:hypothetical protein